MIRRVSDFSNLSNESFEKIAQVVKDRDKKKLYKICNNEQDVKIALQEIKIQGYNSSIEKLGEKYHVYSILPECIEMKEAEKSGNGVRIFSKYLLDKGYVKEKTFI